MLEGQQQGDHQHGAGQEEGGEEAMLARAMALSSESTMLARAMELSTSGVGQGLRETVASPTLRFGINPNSSDSEHASSSDASSSDRLLGLNAAGNPVAAGRDSEYRHKFYCGKQLGRDAIPGSDGGCGPSNGPQCRDCAVMTATSKNRAGAPVNFGDSRHKTTFFCGRRLGSDAIPGSDGQCGPNNGPPCGDCKALVGQHHDSHLRHVKLGDRVQVRDTGEEWEGGEVTQTEPTVKVRKDGLSTAYTWDEMRIVSSPQIQCPAGHLMLLSDDKPGGYAGGWVCDDCRSRSSQTHEAFRYFCSACHADYCKMCAQDSTREHKYITTAPDVEGQDEDPGVPALQQATSPKGPAVPKGR
jgi:hypothetical protein